MQRPLPESATSANARARIAFILLPLLTLAFHLLTAKGYGYFRDELYYLACAQHLDAGYVDHPPLIAWLVAAARQLLGESVVAIRVLPAMFGAGTVVVTAEIARAMGGKRFAQSTAALCTAVAPVYVSLAGYLSMNCVDVFVWAILWLLFVRLLNGSDGRLWLLFGVVAGIGLENKLSVLFLGTGIIAGTLLSGRWRLLAQRRAWVGAALCAALFLPHMLWQLAHGAPTLEFMQNAREGKMIELALGSFLSEQVINMNPSALIIWIAGLGSILLSPARSRLRPVGVAFLVILALLILQGAKPYYLAASFTALFAAGGVAWESWTQRAGRRTRLGTGVRALLLISITIGGAVAAPLAKPVLPLETFVRYQTALGMAPAQVEDHELGRLPQFFADTQGWPELAAAVAKVHAALPGEERERARVFCSNYGQAGAIDLFGSKLGLPPAISGHNAYHTWGPGDFDGGVLIVVGTTRELLLEFFEDATLALEFEHPDAMPYEARKSIWIARRLRGSVEEFWSAIKSFT